MCVIYMAYIFFIIWVVITQFHDVSININKKIVKSKWDSWNLELNNNKNFYKRVFNKYAQKLFDAHFDELFSDSGQESKKEKAKLKFNTNLDLFVNENEPFIILTDEEINNIIETLPIGMDIVEHTRNVWLLKNYELFSLN